MDEAAESLPAGPTIHQHEASAGEGAGGAGGPSVRPETIGRKDGIVGRGCITFRTGAGGVAGGVEAITIAHGGLSRG